MRCLPLLLLFAMPLRADEHFESKIRPVLIEHCIKCHGPEKQKGGLRVDSRGALLKGGDNGAAMTPGNLKSKLIEAIQYGNADLQMPPKGKLPANVITDFEKWVKDGAKWPGEEAKVAAAVNEFNLEKRKAEHWAWKPVTRPAVPDVMRQEWVRDPLDRFILAKLEARGLAPAKEAPKAVWLRRVSYALTGLPPTVQEQLDFENDNTPQAYEKVADRLLASPAYGERWARHWLDLARYAEARGHEFDFEIPNAWLYRDYVIRAFNDDLPYDEFTFEQIAGRGRNGPRQRGVTNESAIGTGFWRLGEEVQSPVDIRQDQADRFDNRIDVFSKTFLGLTVSCARCHDHKFDAISTKDYYGLFGALQGGSDTPIRIDAGSNSVIAALREPKSVQWRETMRKRTQTPEYAKWVSSLNVVASYDCLSPVSTTGIGDWDDAFHHLRGGDVSERTDGVRVEERGAIVLDHYWSNLTKQKAMDNEPGKLGAYARAGFTVRSQPFRLEQDHVWLLVRGGGYSYAAVGNHTVINGPLHGAIAHGFPDSKQYRWVKHSLKDYRGLTFHMEISADPKTDFALAMIVQGDDAPPMPPKLDVPVLTKDEQEKCREEWAKAAAGFEPVWESRLAPGVLDGPGVDERVFIRGNPRTLGEEVKTGWLAAMPKSGFTTPLEGSLHLLAMRTIDPGNPFFSRVMVNRLWHHLFGRGIVPSTDNFGVLGEKPTHPELLDYLSTEFVQNGYRIKPMLRRMVLSASFRQSSDVKNDDRDPNNELLHHFRIRRLEGEAIRDGLLLISGRLDRAIGGPPVPMHLTPLMDGRGRPAKSGPIDGDGRRSIYLAVRRNFLSPFLLAFDTPSPFSTVGTRQVSNVPAQALIFMNDPFVKAEAERWGTGVLKLKMNDTQRISMMFQQAFARTPTGAELELCLKSVDDTKQSWADLAHSLLNTKEFRYVP